MADDPVSCWLQEAQYGEGANATQVRQSARGKDSINPSLVAGVAGLMKVRLRVHGRCLSCMG